MVSSKIKAHLKVAHTYASLSHAKRLKVGAVIVNDNRPISVGYNGTPSGGDNICEVDGITKPEVVHAELNAIAFAARNGTSTKGCTLVVTDSPCWECSKAIIQCGIVKVYYEREYRDATPLEFLNEYDVITERIT